MFNICALRYMSKLCGVMVLNRSIVNWSRGYMYPQYMCIVLYMTLIWCNGIPYIYCQLVWVMDRCILIICAFCYM